MNYSELQAWTHQYFIPDGVNSQYYISKDITRTKSQWDTFLSSHGFRDIENLGSFPRRNSERVSNKFGEHLYILPPVQSDGTYCSTNMTICLDTHEMFFN